MEWVEDSPDRLVARHRPGASSRFTVYLRLFMALCALAGPVLLTVLSMTAPATRVIDCDRSTGQCRKNAQWGHQGWSTFPVSQLEHLTAYSDSKNTVVLGAMVRGRPNYWSNELHSPEDIAALERAVQQMHAFVTSAEPTLHVEFAKGDVEPGPIGRGAIALFGLLLLFWALRTLWSVTIVADRADGTVTVQQRRVLFPGSKTSVPLASIRGVQTVNINRRPGGLPVQYSVVALVREGGKPVLVLREYFSVSSMRVGKELADRLAKFCAVPVEGT